MGLGKTLTMISVVLSELNSGEPWKPKSSTKYPGGTLVVCPASLVGQWEMEVSRRVKRGLISVDCYHGPNRERKAKRLDRASAYSYK